LEYPTYDRALSLGVVVAAADNGGYGELIFIPRASSLTNSASAFLWDVIRRGEESNCAIPNHISHQLRRPYATSR
jgi:hypothetical protein